MLYSVGASLTTTQDSIGLSVVPVQVPLQAAATWSSLLSEMKNQGLVSADGKSLTGKAPLQQVPKPTSIADVVHLAYNWFSAYGQGFPLATAKVAPPAPTDPMFPMPRVSSLRYRQPALFSPPSAQPAGKGASQPTPQGLGGTGNNPCDNAALFAEVIVGDCQKWSSNASTLVSQVQSGLANIDSVIASNQQQAISQLNGYLSDLNTASGDIQTIGYYCTNVLPSLISSAQNMGCTNGATLQSALAACTQLWFQALQIFGVEWQIPFLTGAVNNALAFAENPGKATVTCMTVSPQWYGFNVNLSESCTKQFLTFLQGLSGSPSANAELAAFGNQLQSMVTAVMSSSLSSLAGLVVNLFKSLVTLYGNFLQSDITNIDKGNGVTLNFSLVAGGLITALSSGDPWPVILSEEAALAAGGGGATFLGTPVCAAYQLMWITGN